MRLHKTIAALVGACCLASVALADVSDAQVRALIVYNSIAAYSGNCPCPFNVDRAGRACGARSAWSRAGGASPICYPREVSDAQIRAFRDRHEL